MRIGAFVLFMSAPCLKGLNLGLRLPQLGCNALLRCHLQVCSLYSDALGRTIRLKLAAATLRSVEHRGGLDAYLDKARAKELTPLGRRLKTQIQKTAKAAAS